MSLRDKTKTTSELILLISVARVAKPRYCIPLCDRGPPLFFTEANENTLMSRTASVADMFLSLQ